ncbi:SGNH/GDSL hydrolase family protein [Bradyrhizobium cenepequi]|uniref:SGNH/GDSL hydrolase family protein n=1 Tax=Bradyrhizobium cenepequi TaxID=2821403 RepID=UPI001CE3770C|nr:SGNH/GDSL hydrolase family protein [Bradyrhizobium cenepequi]MCA6105638.1 SGNH/GDSL hydrolase family protein [Bradyrhizobium cenepequi]
MRRREFIAGAAALAAYMQLPKQSGVLAAAYGEVLPGGGNPLPTGFYNFTGSNLINWQRASAAQQRGEADAIIGCLGDSTVAGQGAASNELASNAKSLSWPTQLARLIPNGSWSSVWGDNNVSAAAGDLHAFDARLHRAGWAVSNTRASGTLCGGFFHGQPSATSHSFTPTNPVDTIEVWYARSPGSGRFTIDVDGGPSLAVIDCAGANAFMKATASCTPGHHTINLPKADANDVYLTGLRCFNSAIKEVSVYNLGGCRWGSADFVIDSYPWNTLPAIAAIAPNLVIFQAGIINDWDDRIPLSTVTSNMTKVINALKSVNCDVILMSGAPSEAGVYASYPTQAAYVANMKSLAYAANVPFIDIWGLFGGTWNSFAMNDSLHPNQSGYALIAGYTSTAILDPSARSLS